MSQQSSLYGSLTKSLHSAYLWVTNPAKTRGGKSKIKDFFCHFDFEPLGLFEFEAQNQQWKYKNHKAWFWEWWVKMAFHKATRFYVLAHHDRHKHLYLYTACALDVCVFKCLASLAKEFWRIGPFIPKWWISGSFLSLLCFKEVDWPVCLFFYNQHFYVLWMLTLWEE